VNPAQTTLAAFRKAPAELRGRVTFIHDDGRQTSAEAMGASARGTNSDTFEASVTIEEQHRKLVVMKEGLAFAPKSGMLAEWGKDEDGQPLQWNVLAATAVSPNGIDVVFYRVTLKR
jgi:hypothetical protein